MSLTLLGSRSHYFPTSPRITASGGAPDVTVLPDDTVLALTIADGDVLTLEHLTRDLRLIDSTTLHVPPPSGVSFAYAGLVTLEDGRAVLMVNHGSATDNVREITTGPLTIGPVTGTTDGINWAGTTGDPVRADGMTLIASTGSGTVLRWGGGLIPTVTYPVDGLGTAIADHIYDTQATVWSEADSGIRTIDPTTGTHTGTLATAPPSAMPRGTAVRVGTGWGWPSLVPGGIALVDGGGATISQADLPVAIGGGGAPPSVPQASLPDGTTLQVYPGEDRLTVVVYDSSGAVTGTVALTSDPAYTFAWRKNEPRVRTWGRTVVIAATASTAELNSPAVVTYWTLELSPQGLLTVDTLDVPWWTIGTRDPNMAYEALVDTPLGWKVEIVAGEESLATDELCVYAPFHDEAGDDGWVVCALFRPE